LQGKDEFERQQKELLEKENITKQSKVQLGQEQVHDTCTWTSSVCVSVLSEQGCRNTAQHDRFFVSHRTDNNRNTN